MRRYIGLDILAKSRRTLIETAESEEVTLTDITAWSPTKDHAVPSSHTTRRDVTGIADRQRVRNHLDQTGGIRGLRAELGQVSGFLARPLGVRDRQRDLVEDVG